MEDSSPQQTVFIVDDDAGLLRLVVKALEREGLKTATAASAEEAKAWLAEHFADLLLLDLKLQDAQGVELVGELAAAPRFPPFIIITGQGDERVAVDMMKRGAIDYVVKDAQFLQLLPQVVKRALEQARREKRLAQAEEQVRLVQSVIEHGFSAVLILNGEFPDPRVLYANPAFAERTGYSPEKVVGLPLSALTNLAQLHDRLRHGAAEGQRFLEESFSYHTPRGERWGEWRVGAVRDAEGRVTHWLAILRDITERKRLEKEILEISDRERRRIGQDLHDGLCQQLAGIELMSQVAAQKLASRSKAQSARVGEIARYVRDAISQTRLLARGLSPVMLESEGLMTALQELASNTEHMFGVSCVFACEAPVLLDDHSAATHLYRIAQEAVSNAIKHGKARHIRVNLTTAGAKCVLMVKDDGIGLPKLPRNHNGMGLRIMEYRAGMVGGALMVERDLEGGTSVVCSIPRATGPRKPEQSSA